MKPFSGTLVCVIACCHAIVGYSDAFAQQATEFELACAAIIENHSKIRSAVFRIEGSFSEDEVINDRVYTISGPYSKFVAIDYEKGHTSIKSSVPVLVFDKSRNTRVQDHRNSIYLRTDDYMINGNGNGDFVQWPNTVYM